jgi:uncharacterized membrane protein YhaH (DUF805 family)
MTDDVSAQEAPPRKVFPWLAGRSSRREYWVYVGLLLIISYSIHAPPIIGLVLTLALIWVQIRRLHDFGWHWRWALVAAAAPLVVLPLMIIASEETVVGVGAMVVLPIVILIGAVPGNSGDNRFGPPPPFTLRRVLTGR